MVGQFVVDVRGFVNRDQMRHHRLDTNLFLLDEEQQDAQVVGLGLWSPHNPSLAPHFVAGEVELCATC